MSWINFFQCETHGNLGNSWLQSWSVIVVNMNEKYDWLNLKTVDSINMCQIKHELKKYGRNMNILFQFIGNMTELTALNFAGNH